MYSVVLMVALTGSAETTECRHRCHGWYDCCGYYTCCSYRYTCGCWGYYTPVYTGYYAPYVVAPMSAASPATLVVNLPAQAALTVDGNATTSTSARRVFVTPALDTNGQYVYNLTATIDGQVQTQTVTVQGGRTTEVNFDFAPAVASR